MRVFVFEHICGGGLIGSPLPPRLADEGGAMLAAVVQDFVATGAAVSTTLDPRVTLDLSGAEVTLVGESLPDAFDALARQADVALIIAPEFDHLLCNWLGRLERLGVRWIGCTRAAVALTGDKLALAAHLTKRGIPTPPTSAGPPLSLRGPVVVKPRFGAGCEETFLCRTDADVASLPQREDWITQPLVEGRACSAAFLINPKADGQKKSTIRPLLAGAQHIGGTHALRYGGGSMPLDPANARRAMTLAERAVRTVEGLSGFVGVDLILADDPALDSVIEINPRICVSYVGLRRLCTGNLAAAMLDPAAPLAWRDGRVRYTPGGRWSWESA